MREKFEQLCADKGIKITEQRKVVADVISSLKGHPTVEQIYLEAIKVDPNVSIATVYRTVRLFQEQGMLEEHRFKDGVARYEEVTDDDDHHHHLIDLISDKVIEFHDDKLEKIIHDIAKKAGYKLLDHRLDLYGVPLEEE